MRRAIPYPCSGPSACSVFSTIKASVPCQTSFFSPIVFSCSSYGLPIPICYSPYGNAIEETQDLGILFPVFLSFHADWRCRFPTEDSSSEPRPARAIAPQILTLRKLPTSLMRLVLQLSLPGDGLFPTLSRGVLHAIQPDSQVRVGSLPHRASHSFLCYANSLCSGRRTIIFRHSRCKSIPCLGPTCAECHDRDLSRPHRGSRERRRH